MTQGKASFLPKEDIVPLGGTLQSLRCLTFHRLTVKSSTTARRAKRIADANSRGLQTHGLLMSRYIAWEARYPTTKVACFSRLFYNLFFPRA